MTELSARKWVEMNRTDVAHLFRWVYPHQSTHAKIKKQIPGIDILEKNDLKLVAVVQIGLKLGGTEATRFRICFKRDFFIKNFR